MKKTHITKKRMTFYAALAIIIAVLPFLFHGFNMKYLIMVACFTEIYIIAVSGLDILFGYCGQISLGHAAYFAIGSYGAGLIYNYFKVPMVLSMFIAAAIAAGVGALLAMPASKLKFHFLSLATVSFGEIIYQILAHSPGEITGNFVGFFTDRLTIFGIEIGKSNMRFFYFGLIAVILFMTAKHTLVNSKTGRAFIAVRENTLAAEGMGVNIRKYKVIAFATSAFYTAFAGSMYMFYVGYVHPSMYMQKQSVLFLTMLLFGGTGSFIGPVLGVTVVEILNESTRFLEDYQLFVYGIILLIVIIAMPGGIYGVYKDIAARLKLKMTSKKGVTAHADNR